MRWISDKWSNVNHIIWSVWQIQRIVKNFRLYNTGYDGTLQFILYASDDNRLSDYDFEPMLWDFL